MSGKQAWFIPVIVGLCVSKPILLVLFTVPQENCVVSFILSQELLIQVDSKLLGKNTLIELVPWPLTIWALFGTDQVNDNAPVVETLYVVVYPLSTQLEPFIVTLGSPTLTSLVNVTGFPHPPVITNWILPPVNPFWNVTWIELVPCPLTIVELSGTDQL